MLSVMLAGSVAFIITFLAIPAIIKVADEKKLFDLPDARKLHKKPIASLGGVGVFIGFLLATLLSSAKDSVDLHYFFAAAILIFFIGVKDDILILTAAKKFLAQVAAAAIVIHLGGIRIDSMHGLFGITHIPSLLGLALSYITIILIVNAYNLIDGVDGLAGSLGLLTMLVFGSYFYSIGLSSFATMAFAMAGSLLAFLIFNYNPAKIFLGDSGSLLLGLINAILAIKFITVADSKAVAIPVASAVVVGIAILMVPLMDTLRVFSMRIFNGRSPFSPDRNHFHHLLLDCGLSHKYVTFFSLLLNVLFIAVAYFSRSLGPTYLLLSMLAISLAVLAIVHYFRKNRQAVIIKAEKAKVETTPGAVTSFTKVAPVMESQPAMHEN